MKSFILGIIISVGAMVSLTALADLSTGTPLLTWQFPTENTDESPLGIDNLKETILECYSNPNLPPPVNLPKNVKKIITVPDNFWQAEVNEFDSGEYTCRAAVTNTDEITSSWSDEISFLVPYKTPKSPVTFGVN